jgi:hypothetical protein
MSDQPSPTTPSPTTDHTALRDTRWLAAGIWAGLLAALLVTSGTAVESFTTGSIASRCFSISSSGVNGDNGKATAIVGLVLSGIAAAALFGGWWAFVRATRSLVLAYSDAGSGNDEEPAPAEWVTETEAADSTTTIFRAVPADLLVFIGVAWVAIVMTPAVLAAVQVFSR